MQNVPKSFRKFKKVPLVLSVSLLVISLVGLMLLLRGINQNKVAAETARAEWQAEALRRYELKSLDTLLKNAEAERKELDTHFATRENVVPFLDSIEDLARRAGASPEVVSIDETPDKNSLFVIIRAEGSWSAVYKFLELLENSAYELEFIAADIGKKPESADWEASFKIKLLTFIPQ